MISYIVTHIDTGEEVELVLDQLILVGRYEADPSVAVARAGHDHVGSCLGSGVHVLNCAIVECPVGAAEERGKRVVGVCAVPRGIAERLAIVSAATLTGRTSGG